MVSTDRMNALLNRSFLLLMSLCVSLSSLDAIAATLPLSNDGRDWYQIEFALFEHTEGARSELRYEANKYAPLQSNEYQYYFETPYYDLAYPLLPSRHFSKVEAGSSVLSGAAKRLVRDRKTDLIEFAAWQQAIDNDSATLPLKLSRELSDGRQLEGYVRIRRERYMHIEVDIFVFTPKYFANINWVEWLNSPLSRPLISLLVPAPNSEIQSDAATNSNTPVLPYLVNDAPINDETEPLASHTMLAMNLIRFTDSRRVKEGELHYLDHPALGLIASIKKLELPEKLIFEGDTPQ